MRITKLAKYRNQNNFRLTDLKPIESFHKDIQDAIRTHLSSKGDRAHQVAGLFLWSAISHSRSVNVIGRDDLQKLIDKAGAQSLLPEGTFKMASSRIDGKRRKSIYAQFTGYLIQNGIAKLLLERNLNKPGVLEIIDEELLKHLPPISQEEKHLIVNSVDQGASKLQDSNTTKLQGNNIPKLQDNETTRESALQDEPQKEKTKYELSTPEPRLKGSILKLRQEIRDNTEFNKVLSIINNSAKLYDYDLSDLNSLLLDLKFTEQLKCSGPWGRRIHGIYVRST